MITYDVTQPKSFSSVEIWKKEFEMCLGSKDSSKAIPFILIGNKVDLIHSRKVPEDKAREWCRRNGDMPYFETSAKDGTAVKEVFMAAGQMAVRSRKELM